MTKQTGIGDRLYWHGTNISGDVASLQGIRSQVALLPLTDITCETEERTQGLSTGMLAFASWFNKDLSLPILDDFPSTDVVALYTRGQSIGSPCFAISAKQSAHNPDRGADGSLSLAVEAQGSGVAGEWAELLTAGQVTFASSAADEPTGIVVAAQTTAGGVGYLQFEERASGTPTFIIEDSADTTDGDDGTWGTLLTFDGTGGASPFGERKTVTGTVEKGVRAGTPTGTYSNAVCVIAFRRGVSGDREDLS